MDAFTVPVHFAGIAKEFIVSNTLNLGFTTVRVMRGFGRFAVPVSEEETPDYTVDNLRQLIFRLKGFCQGEG